MLTCNLHVSLGPVACILCIMRRQVNYTDLMHDESEPRASLFADLNLKFQSKEVKPVTPAESEPISPDGPGIVLSFGSNGYGRLGLGMNESECRDGARAVVIPRLICTTLVAKEMACGAGHVICCVGGVCHAWGKCHFAQLGLDSEDMDCFAPTALPRDLFDGANIVCVETADYRRTRLHLGIWLRIFRCIGNRFRGAQHFAGTRRVASKSSRHCRGEGAHACCWGRLVFVGMGQRPEGPAWAWRGVAVE
jgi:hypothetical protein